MLRLIALFIAMVLIGLAAYARVVQIDPETYHVDPETAPTPKVPGHILLRPGSTSEAPIFLMKAEDLAAKLNTVIQATPRTRVLAGGLDQGYASFVTRSAIFSFPDIANVKVIDLGEGKSTVAILSRLRIGQMDFGVNEARVKSWLAQLAAQ